MKNNLKLFIVLLSLLSILILNVCSVQTKFPEKTSALVVVGGHEFDTIDFYGMFFSFKDMQVDTISQPHANALLETDVIQKYDVLVFYDMWQDITDQQKTGLIELMKEGKGMVFLHHSLASYQGWDEFINIVGGRYHLEHGMKDTSELSGFKHDLDFEVKILDNTHPVTCNMSNFKIHDEGYYNIEIIPVVYPLLEVDHPSCAKFVSWASKYENSRIVYILLGHDKHAYQNESFKLLVENAVKWTAAKDSNKQF